MSKGAQFYLLVLATTATASLTVMGADSYSRLRCMSEWADRYPHMTRDGTAIGNAVHACNGSASNRF
ncbi:MAG: hypothetical protein VYE46_03165 [Cyanobacteriota bacterium]|nr:hypothetical protein [Cyanobacteriota bacterium]